MYKRLKVSLIFVLGLLGFTIVFIGVLQKSKNSFVRVPANKDENSYDPITMKDGRWTLESHRQASLKRISSRLGTSSDALKSFFASLKEKNLKVAQSSSHCLNNFTDTPKSRNAVLNCLARYGRSGLDEELFSILFDLRQERIQDPDGNLETHKTLALLSWMEDLIRANRLEQGLSAHWYVKGEGFIDVDHHADFPYEDGDALLVLGGSSISSVITQSTYPQRKYSHALIMRVRDGKDAITMESLIETGVIAKTKDKYSKGNLNTVQVLRWRDKATRKEIASKASDISMQWVKDKVPYDMAMDMSDDSSLFCSEQVLLAYARASNLKLTDLHSNFAKIRSKTVLDYLKNVGVNNEVMPSPGDIGASEYFESVAEYRDVGHLERLWELLLMGDVFVERLEMGYLLKPLSFVELATLTVALSDRVLSVPRILLGADLSLIPASLDRNGLAYVITQEKLVFAKAYRSAAKSLGLDKEKRWSLFDVAPWEYRSHLSYAVQESWRIRNVLAPPKESDKRRIRQRTHRVRRGPSSAARPALDGQGVYLTLEANNKLEGLIRFPQNLIGLELLEVEGSDELNSRWGHAMIRLVDNDGDPLNDVVLNFYPDFETEVNHVLSVLPHYPLGLELNTFRVFLDRYPILRSKKIYRIPILSTPELRLEFLSRAREYLDDPHKRGRYTALSNNCLSIILVMLEEAGFPSAGPKVFMPENAQGYFRRVGLAPYPKITIHTNDLLSMTLIDETLPLDYAMYNVCRSSECADDVRKGYFQNFLSQSSQASIKKMLRPVFQEEIVGLRQRGPNRSSMIWAKQKKRGPRWHGLKNDLLSHYELLAISFGVR